MMRTHTYDEMIKIIEHVKAKGKLAIARIDGALQEAVTAETFDFSLYRYEIIKQPAYRPLETTEEALPWIGRVLKRKRPQGSATDVHDLITSTFKYDNEQAFIVAGEEMSAAVVFENYTDMSGNPIGIKE